MTVCATPSSKNGKQRHFAVCISHSKNCENVLFAAAEEARQSSARLSAVCIENTSATLLPSLQEEDLQDNIQLARRLGAHVVILEGANPIWQIADFCRRHDVCRLIYSRGCMSKWQARLLGKAMDKDAPNVCLQIIPDESKIQSIYFSGIPRIRFQRLWQGLSVSILLLAAATFSCWLFTTWHIDEAVLAPIYILGVVLCAVLTESLVWPAVFAILSILTFGYFFAAPQLSLQLSHPGYAVIFFVTIAVSMIAGLTTSRLHQQSVLNRQSTWRTQTLLETSRLLQEIRDPEQIWPALCEKIAIIFHRDVLFYPYQSGILQKPVFYPSPNHKNHTMPSDPIMTLCARNAVLKDRPTGSTTDFHSSNPYLFFPVNIRDKNVGAAAIYAAGFMPESTDIQMIQSMIGEGVIAMESLLREKEVQDIRMKSQSDMLRSNLLKAISHDLRTPLTSIIGSASVLKENRETLDEAQKNELLQSVTDNSLSLFAMVENLLSASRIENGIMPVHPSPEILEDVLREAVRIARVKNQNHPVLLEGDDSMTMVNIDTNLIGLVIANLIQNVFVHTPDGVPVTVSLQKTDTEAIIEVRDTGPGISEEMKPFIFDLFYTGNSKILDSARSLGLGLYLCQEIVKSHSSILTVRDNEPAGSIFSFTLPLFENEIF